MNNITLSWLNFIQKWFSEGKSLFVIKFNLFEASSFMKSTSLKKLGSLDVNNKLDVVLLSREVNTCIYLY